MAVRELAPAKINLDLRVVDRRADGYHELDSLVVFAEVADALDLAPADGLSLRVEGPHSGGVPDDASNLVLRAALALAERAGVEPKASITLGKRLPVQAGIGGGSSDAAAALRGLNRLWGLNLPLQALCDVGAALGADVPVCVVARPCRVRGAGGRLDPVRGLPDLPLLLVNPLRPVPTPAVFKALEPSGWSGTRRGGLPFHPSVAQLAHVLGQSANDLEVPATRVEPIIAETLALLRGLEGAALVRMSGSGATCFALFLDERARDAAAEALTSDRPGWWVAPANASGRGVAS